MTHRERILAILDGEPPDQIPWIPRLAIWYEAHKRRGTLPEPYCGMSLRQVERAVFGGTAARDAIIYRTRLHGVEVRRHRPTPLETIEEYVTPVGTVWRKLQSTPQLRRDGIQVPVTWEVTGTLFLHHVAHYKARLAGGERGMR
ncbi:MAG TPA: hypothetical protein EYP56_01320, partial [Planctomycetaceae bacterium]|nr:hypothetical protein [Planctomycetaceae bacterium]